jgi:hypothetical protein
MGRHAVLYQWQLQYFTLPMLVIRNYVLEP